MTVAVPLVALVLLLVVWAKLSPPYVKPIVDDRLMRVVLAVMRNEEALKALNDSALIAAASVKRLYRELRESEEREWEEFKAAHR